MTLRVKNIIYSALLLLAMFVVWKYRSAQAHNMVAFSGKTMGPIVYNVKYFDETNTNYQQEIDSLLHLFNKSLNTYKPESEISQFNADTAFYFQLPFFYKALVESKKIYKSTSGAFDPSIGPLIENWGFGKTNNIKIDSSLVDSLLSFTGFDKIYFDAEKVWKMDRRVQIDFSASAKGYGVDVVVDFLVGKGLENIFVEIGGELRVAGKNLNTKKPWKVGILDPNSTEINAYPYALASISDRGMATSGNYFNYHTLNGVKYGHTINPVTGFPIEHPLLSASVFATTCHEADALATAFMVMGHEKAIQFLNGHDQYDAFLIFSDPNGNMSTYATEGISEYIELVDNE